MTLTVGSLFSGIGGLDLGLERAGMEVIWQSEIDPYACKVLSKHWPKVPNHGNIKEINWGDVVRPDIICGGYPCQPFSTAGKRNGTDDPRHLWPWVREAISELRPKYAILENVRGHITLGLSTVIGDLASIGYGAEWNIVSAAAVGAPHRRDRVFIVAYPNGQRLETQGAELKTSGVVRGNKDSRQSLAHPDSERLERRSRLQKRSKEHGRPNIFGTNPKWHQEWTNRQWWESEPNVGRVAYGVPSRVDRLKGLGNAVVPQVAELIGRMVIDYDTNL